MRTITRAMPRNSSAVERPSVVNLEKRRSKKEKYPSSGDGGFLTRDERREATAFILMAAAVVVAFSLILNPSELQGIFTSETPISAGKFGKWLAAKLGMLFGFGSLIFPATLGLWSVAIYRKVAGRTLFIKGLALTLCLIATCALMGLVYPEGYLGGALGERLREDLQQTFGHVSYLVLLFAICVTVVIGTPLSFSSLFSASLTGARLAGGVGLRLVSGAAGALRQRGEEVVEKRRRRPRNEEADDEVEEDEEDSTEAPAAEAKSDKGSEYFDRAETRVVNTPALRLVRQEMEDVGLEDEETEPEELPEEPAAKSPKGRSGADKKEKPLITALPLPPADPGTPLDAFSLPPLTLLENGEPAVGITEEDLRQKAELLRARLANFEIESKIGDIVAGPTVTRFEVVPAPGVTVSSITARADDIALAMAAPSIRIEAPIPGKTAVGIEIPNPHPQKVTLKEVLTSEEFRKAREKSPLAVALGLDIAGRPVIADLRRMPHLLIAGATGSGKSVCINSIITSLALAAKPTEVRMLMIDPKVVELQNYNDIPHLLAPVVTNVKQAPKVLIWAGQEMERRFEQLAHAGVRNIEDFNRLEPQAAGDENADEFTDIEDELKETTLPAAPRSGEKGSRMPYIIIIIDEFCDLMMIARKECEDAITQMASMARAVGIHLIIATQRPSVDVITGTIKANLPSRIAFQVTSRVDSKTILDNMGAERLLGRGDMLYKPVDLTKPLRLQGSFIGDGEINRILKHYADQGHARREFIFEEGASFEGLDGSLTEADDPLLEKALAIVLQDGHASVSRLQRRLNIGHPRAARLVDIMEAKALVSPPDGSKPRALLFDETYLAELRREREE